MSEYSLDDGVASTIFAPATPNAVSAIGIFRVSGPSANQLFDDYLKGGKPEARVFTVMRLIDPADGKTIDEVGVLRFEAPASYTGLDLVEIHHHGSPAIARWLSGSLGRRANFRHALPGEFTRQALRHGRVDATHVDGIDGLIHANSVAELKMSSRALQGENGAKLARWKASIKDVLVRIEAEIDFGEEGDVLDNTLAETRAALVPCLNEIEETLSTSRLVQEVREGSIVVLFGAPNVGKSSLLNALVRREAAIVTSEAGTTRDPIAVSLELDGQPVQIVDTAGLRQGESEAECLGIEMSRSWIERANIRIRIADSIDTFHAMEDDEDELWVLSKYDLRKETVSCPKIIPTSAKTGEGLTLLVDKIKARLQRSTILEETPVVWSLRQTGLLQDVAAHLRRISILPHSAMDLIAEELRLALLAFGRLTGHVDDEDILDDLFARFCIGK